MSIAVLNQVYDEVRRLAIAGSDLASGDFRLKKLIEPLRKSAAKAPVFGKVAESVEKLVGGPTKDSAQSLLNLSTLVTAILYTQGETGAEGRLKAIETSDMGTVATATSARVMKPLIEALTTTGSGRLEIIRDAHQRGAFRDLRLVNPAIQAVDDPYGEIGDFVADEVLPQFGTSIYPELKAAYDPKGRGGHIRRLRLMDRLDPQATRELVHEALESGSKEMKVEAIRCLKGSKEDLPQLLEQATAKSKDVRAAAIESFAALADNQVVEALIKSLSGADVDLAAGPASANRSPKLLKFLLSDAEKQLEDVFQAKPKTKQTKMLARFQQFLSCFAGRSDKKTVDFLTRCFERREEIAILDADVNWKVAAMLVLTGSKPALKSLVDALETLGPEVLDCAFLAASQTRSPKQVYDLFSPYLLVKAGPKKKGRDPALAKKETIRELLLEGAAEGMHGYYYRDWRYHNLEHGRDLLNVLRAAKLDPRWLDAAVSAEDQELVSELIRPKHKGAIAFLSKQFDAQIKKKSIDYEIARVLDAMIRAEHPKVTDCYIQAVKRLARARLQYYYTYFIGRLIPQLPKGAAAELEKLMPTLPDKAIDELAPYLEELKSKS